MREIEFKNWLSNRGVKKKVQYDIVSRGKKVEKELCSNDIDQQYKNDKCESIMRSFSNKGINPNMPKEAINKLPVGKYHISTYKYAVKYYLMFYDELNNS